VQKYCVWANGIGQCVDKATYYQEPTKSAVPEFIQYLDKSPLIPAILAIIFLYVLPLIFLFWAFRNRPGWILKSLTSAYLAVAILALIKALGIQLPIPIYRDTYIIAAAACFTFAAFLAMRQVIPTVQRKIVLPSLKLPNWPLSKRTTWIGGITLALLTFMMVAANHPPGWMGPLRFLEPFVAVAIFLGFIPLCFYVYGRIKKRVFEKTIVRGATAAAGAVRQATATARPAASAAPRASTPITPGAMRVKIERTEVEKGLLNKSREYGLKLTILFSETQKAVIKQGNLGEYVIFDDIPQHPEMADIKTVWKIRDFVPGKPRPIVSGADLAATQVVEGKVKDKLQELKQFLENTTVLQDRPSTEEFEL
jgi:hypothetical protein